VLAQFKNYIVIGSSKGLGAALVQELLNNEQCFVYAVSRTSPEEIPDYEKWQKSDRFRYFQTDISDKEQVLKLTDINNFIKDKPVCIIFNAACLKTDVNDNKFIDFKTLREVKNTGIDGLINILEVFQSNLINYGGIFIGISSFSTISPAICPEMIAYRAAKTFLNTLLDDLRFIWRNNKNIKIMTVNLGYMRKNKSTNQILEFLFPSYNKVAKKIVKTVNLNNIPEELNYTFFYTIIYRFFALMPNTIYYFIFHVILKKTIECIKKN